MAFIYVITNYLCDLTTNLIFCQIPASAVEMPASMNNAQLDVQFGNWDAMPAAVSASAESGSGMSFTADVASQQSHYGAPTHRYRREHVLNHSPGLNDNLCVRLSSSHALR